MTSRTALLLAACTLLGSSLEAQPAARPAPAVSLLRQLDASVEDLTRRVSPSVVQVLVSGYAPVDERNRGETGMVIAPQHSMGSGAIVDADGYVITNAHVVAGARRVQVVLHDEPSAAGGVGALAQGGRTVDARVVGSAGDLDLALLKIEATGLQPIRLADYDHLRQGQLVFAFGSPEGLRDSVSMGVVSAVARQPDPDRPAVYVQTDAPINPGNSGGPLVDVDGELVGINTFIISDSGGSQGLGFAIPSAVVAAAYPQLRKYGHLHRGMVGLNLQAISPALARGLGLPRPSGVIVSDVMPGGPADQAGIEIQDVIAAVNGKPADNVPMLSLELGMAGVGDTVSFDLLRDGKPKRVLVTVKERPHPIDDLTDLADPDTNGVAELGIVAIDVNNDTAPLMSDLRIRSGVFVLARTPLPSQSQSPLLAGDVIHALDTTPVRSIDGLRVLLDGRRQTDVVLQIERDGTLQYLTLHVE